MKYIMASITNNGQKMRIQIIKKAVKQNREIFMDTFVECHIIIILY